MLDFETVAGGLVVLLGSGFICSIMTLIFTVVTLQHWFKIDLSLPKDKLNATLTTRDRRLIFVAFRIAYFVQIVIILTIALLIRSAFAWLVGWVVHHFSFGIADFNFDSCVGRLWPIQTSSTVSLDLWRRRGSNWYRCHSVGRIQLSYRIGGLQLSYGSAYSH
jgi:hypothetical protein